jgi:hypothetical protein
MSAAKRKTNTKTRAFLSNFLTQTERKRQCLVCAIFATFCVDWVFTAECAYKVFATKTVNLWSGLRAQPRFSHLWGRGRRRDYIPMLICHVLCTSRRLRNFGAHQRKGPSSSLCSSLFTSFQETPTRSPSQRGSHNDFVIIHAQMLPINFE